jgi:hypothetical protein
MMLKQEERFGPINNWLQAGRLVLVAQKVRDKDEPVCYER